MVRTRNLVKVGNREIKKRYVGNKLIFEDLGDKTEILSGEEIYTDKADDSVVHVEVDGKSYQDGVPTPDYPIEIHSLNDFDVVSSVGGRNLVSNADKYNYKITDFTNVKLVDSFDMKELRNSKITLSLDVDMSNATSGNVYFEISLAFTDGTNGWYSVYLNVPDSGNFLGRISHTNTIPDKEVQRIRHFAIFDKTVGGETLLTKPKLEINSEATPYSLAPEDILENDNHPLIDKINLSLSEPLRSVRDVKDRLFRDSDGLWKIERKFLEYQADGSEDWIYKSTYNRFDMSRSVGADTGAIYNGMNSHFLSKGASNNDKGNITWVFNGTPRVIHHGVNDSTELKAYMKNQYESGAPVTWVTEIVTPTIEVLDQELQDKLNNLRSFQDSNYVYTITNEENLKPTLHTTFKSKGWYDYYLKTLLK